MWHDFKAWHETIMPHKGFISTLETFDLRPHMSILMTFFILEFLSPPCIVHYETPWILLTNSRDLFWVVFKNNWNWSPPYKVISHFFPSKIVLVQENIDQNHFDMSLFLGPQVISIKAFSCSKDWGRSCTPKVLKLTVKSGHPRKKILKNFEWHQNL